MKVLLVGTSWTLSVTLPPEHRFPTVLAALLEERFPEQEIELRTEAWVDFSPPRRAQLLTTIKQQPPDYLILAPTGVWVTFPLIAPALMRRLPQAVHSPAYHMVRSLRSVDRQFSQKGWTWHGYLYRPIDWIGRVLGARPLYTVPEALDALEELVVMAKRQESTEILMLPRNALTHPQATTNSDPQMGRMMSNPSFARIIPPNSIPLWNVFGEGVIDLCRKHRIMCVDIWSGTVADVNQDGYHPGAETARQQASRVRDAIVDLEGAYQR